MIEESKYKLSANGDVIPIALERLCKSVGGHP